MKDKIVKYLKIQLPGVQDTFLDRVAEDYSKTITEESQIASAFTPNIIDLLKGTAGFIQSEGDRRANDAISSYREKHGLDENGKPKDKKEKDKSPKEEDKDEPAWFKAHREKQEAVLQGLEGKLAKLEGEKKSLGLQSKVKEALKAKGVYDSFYKSRLAEVDSDEKVEGFVKQIEADFEEFRQEMVNDNVVINRPKGGGEASTPTKVIAENIAEARNSSSKKAEQNGIKAKEI
jgi:hypothetical protein